jgi:hypothetical protein
VSELFDEGFEDCEEKMFGSWARRERFMVCCVA